jgi:SAM-dependent methyltransferase
VLDVGAGTGRVTLELARAGHEVIALDRDRELLAALAQRAAADGLEVTTVLADARDFTVPASLALCLVPMQTIQLLGGPRERLAFLACARTALAPGGRLAVAIADALEPFEVPAGSPAPLPDVDEIDGTVYCSRPRAVRELAGGFVLERRREMVSSAGELTACDDHVRLARLAPERLEAEGAQAGFAVADREQVATTAEYVGSTVVVLDA